MSDERPNEGEKLEGTSASSEQEESAPTRSAPQHEAWAGGGLVVREQPEVAIDEGEPTGGLTTFLYLLMGAACIVFSFAPWDFFPLAFVGLVPFLAATRHTSDASVFRRALLGGFLINLGGFPWVAALVVRFGGLPLWIGILAMLALCLQQGLVYGLGFWIGRKVERGFRWAHGVALPITFVAVESLMPLIFPWRLGHSQVYHPAFTQSIELGGVFLTSALVVAVNVALYRSALQVAGTPRKGIRRSRYALVVAVFVAVNYLFGLQRLAAIDAAQERADHVAIGLAEADIEIEDKWDAGLYQDNLLRHQRLSAELEEQGAELVVWPESAFELSQYYYAVDPRFEGRVNRVLFRDVGRMVPSDAPLPAAAWHDRLNEVPLEDRSVPQRGFRVPLLTGTTLTQRLDPEESSALPPYSSGPRRHLSYNSSLLFDEEGRVLGIADKVVRMPISETIPGGVWLYQSFGINLWKYVPSSGLFGAGDGPTVLELPLEDERETVRIGVLVCYEDLMPNFVRDMVDEQPNVLINLTNDAWFGRNFEPDQHFALAIPRAIEARTWLIRSTNTGVSAFVDAAGRVVGRTDVYDAESLLRETALMPARRTLFVRLGNWPGYGSLLVTVAGLVMLWRRRRSERQAVARP